LLICFKSALIGGAAIFVGEKSIGTASYRPCSSIDIGFKRSLAFPHGLEMPVFIWNDPDHSTHHPIFNA
jgi:hypothetical protein